MISVTTFELHLDRLPAEFDGFRIVQLSDLHGKWFGEQNSRLFQSILRQKPDVVVTTGDMLDNPHEHGASFLELTRQLTQHVPVYCVRGNHEQRSAERDNEIAVLEKYENALRLSGAILLNDSTALFSRDGAELLFYGITLPMFCYKPQAAKNPGRCLPAEMISKHLGMVDENHCCILLAHTPLFFPSYEAWGADLVLAGHMHGGLVRLPGLRGLLSPYHRFFPEYDAGLFTYGESNMVVSRGLGEASLRVRICNPPEIVVVSLCSRREKQK